MNLYDLIGAKWALPCNPPESYDCWALVVEVRKRMGFKTPAYHTPPHKRTSAHRRALNRPDPTVWRQLDEPKIGCVVGFGHRWTQHVGVCLGASVIHASNSDVAIHALTVAKLSLGPATYWELI